MMRRVTLISVPFDLDQYEQGQGQAPLALMIAGLPGILQANGVQIVVERRIPPTLEGDDLVTRLGNLGRSVADLVAEACAADTLPIILGGDCFNAVAINAGLRQAKGGQDLGIAWFDAHGDFNTPDISPSGYFPGMPLACICGYGGGSDFDALRAAIGLEQSISTEHVIMMGIRDLDAAEKELLDSTPISYLNPAEVRDGRTAVAAGYHFSDVEQVYLHLDMDVLDPEISSGVGYPTPGGLSVAEVLQSVAEVRQHASLMAVALTGVNPAKDVDGKTARAALDLLGAILRD